MLMQIFQNLEKQSDILNISSLEHLDSWYFACIKFYSVQHDTLINVYIVKGFPQSS
jgi:hypothetical protein